MIAASPPKKRKRNDSDLKRVSISTNSILFTTNFELKKSMADLLPALSKKYRIFLITQVPGEGGEEHTKAK